MKNYDTALHRRPDVLVTWHDGSRLALEVEYKEYAKEDWRAKQDDLDAEGIGCVWLLGHTKFAAWGEVASRDGTELSVRLPRLAQVLAADGWHVLVVNPITRQIGTLAGDPELTTRINPHWLDAYLGLDDLTACEFDAERGLVTPTIRRIDEAVDRRERAAARQVNEYQAQLQAQETRERARQDKWARIAEDNHRAWEASPFKQAVMERWVSLPDLLAEPGNQPWYIHALPVHWHAVIYEEHVHHPEPGSIFTVDACWETLRRQRIGTNWEPKKRFKSLVNFLDAMARHGLIERAGRYQWRVRANLDIMAALRREEQRQKQEEAREREEERHRIREQSRVKEEKAKALAEKQQRDREQAWLGSDIRRVIIDQFAEIPRCIAWPNRYLTEAIDAHPALWRAHVCMALIDDAPAGTEVTVSQAISVLEAAGIECMRHQQTVVAAVAAYLYNLRQRGILTQVADDETRYRTTRRPLT